jgi:hypothetical protein
MPKVFTMQKFAAMSLLGLCLMGCGGPADNPIEAKPPAAIEDLRNMLTELEKSGQSIGSGGMVISEHIEEIRKTDAAKADKLQKSADDLMSATAPAKVKSLAKEMLSNL